MRNTRFATDLRRSLEICGDWYFLASANVSCDGSGPDRLLFKNATGAQRGKVWMEIEMDQKFKNQDPCFTF